MYINKDLFIQELEKIEGKTIDKELVIRLANNCETDPYKELLLRLYKEKQ